MVILTIFNFNAVVRMNISVEIIRYAFGILVLVMAQVGHGSLGIR